MFNTLSSVFQKSLRYPIRPSFAGTCFINFSKCSYSNQKPSVVSQEEKKDSSSKPGDKKVFISLIGIDGIPKTSTLEAAEKLSKRRDFKLIKISVFDAKRGMPVYKLLSGTQLIGEDIIHKKQNKGKAGFKTEKIVIFSYNISEHDLNSKVHKVLKWLEKKHEVRATISGPSSGNQLTEGTYQKIESLLKDHGRILQKRNSGTDIKFQIIPLKEIKNVEKSVEET